MYKNDEKAKNTLLIKKYSKDININTLKQLNISIDLEKLINKNEYEIVLEKARCQYTRIRLINLKLKAKRFIIPLIVTFTIYNVIKYYYILYYYIMWDIDIRKPRVSDYIIERYR
jgi:hypothetical protein